jgi:arabinose-5-phosphate isomerase
MTKNCKTITEHKLAAEALHLMETFKITALTVTHDSDKIIGVVHMHDLLSAGIA